MKLYPTKGDWPKVVARWSLLVFFLILTTYFQSRTPLFPHSLKEYSPYDSTFYYWKPSKILTQELWLFRKGKSTFENRFPHFQASKLSPDGSRIAGAYGEFSGNSDPRQSGAIWEIGRRKPLARVWGLGNNIQDVLWSSDQESVGFLKGDQTSSLSIVLEPNIQTTDQPSQSSMTFIEWKTRTSGGDLFGPEGVHEQSQGTRMIPLMIENPLSFGRQDRRIVVINKTLGSSPLQILYQQVGSQWNVIAQREGEDRSVGFEHGFMIINPERFATYKNQAIELYTQEGTIDGSVSISPMSGRWFSTPSPDGRLVLFYSIDSTGKPVLTVLNLMDRTQVFFSAPLDLQLHRGIWTPDNRAFWVDGGEGIAIVVPEAQTTRTLKEMEQKGWPFPVVSVKQITGFLPR